MPFPPTPQPSLVNEDLFLSDEFRAVFKKMVQDELTNFHLYSGVGGTQQQEIQTNYDETPAETVLRGKTNSYIIFGNDRSQGPESGKGGSGGTACSAIDLVAGLGGARPVDKVNGKTIKISKNFSSDSSRIYISQRANIDEYLGIPNYNVKVGSSVLNIDQSNDRAAIAIKSDCVRVVGRENVKIVTSHLGDNSKGDPASIGGIDIIAGYNVPDARHSLQPMVKGNNLLLVLQKIIDTLSDVQASTTSFLENQMKINNALLHHTHQVGETVSNEPFDQDILANIKILYAETLPTIVKNQAKFGKLIVDYFIPGSPVYINSLYNRVN